MQIAFRFFLLAQPEVVTEMHDCIAKLIPEAAFLPGQHVSLGSFIET